MGSTRKDTTPAATVFASDVYRNRCQLSLDYHAKNAAGRANRALLNKLCVRFSIGGDNLRHWALCVFRPGASPSQLAGRFSKGGFTMGALSSRVVVSVEIADRLKGS
jgi:hypothetical protein